MSVLHRVLLAAALSTLAYDDTFGIINGKKAKKNTLLFMASVQVDGKHKCGGVLIDRGFILTAAHCFRRKMSVVIGTHNIDKATLNPRQYIYEVKRSHRHHLYNNPKTGNDIMLLELSRKVYLGDAATISYSTKGRANPKCQVAGWGHTETNRNPVKDLMVTDVSVVDFATCNKSWGQVNKQLPRGVMCAGGSEKSGICQGDSGGPLVCDGVVMGIVSFNFDKNCRYPNVPNVYTNIAEYSTWIDRVMGYSA